MKSKTVILELLPTRLDVVVLDAGRVRTAARIALATELGNDVGAWMSGVRGLTRSLFELVKGHNLQGAKTRVLYHSPTQAVDLVSSPARSRAEAVEAAQLQCADSLSYSAIAAVTAGCCVSHDVQGEHKQMHTVVAADRDDVVSTIVELVQQAGLKFVSATPEEAAVLAHLAANVARTPKQTRAVLYIGERSSHFLVGANGTLQFERRLSLGLDALVQSLTRPIRPAPGAEPVELDEAEARRMLMAHGFPARDAIVDQRHGLRGAHIIPSLQPPIQRVIVELRQSLRFGVTDLDRTALQTMIAGPGARVPQLAHVLGTELELPVSNDARYAGFDHEKPGSDGSELRDAVRSERVLDALNTLPNAVAARRRLMKTRGWLWAGAAAAMVMIASDAALLETRLRDARDQAATLNVSQTKLEESRHTMLRMHSVLAAMEKLSSSIVTNVGAEVDCPAVLQEVASLMPGSVRLTTIHLQRVEGQIEGRLNGYAFLTEGRGRSVELETFIQRLRRSPLLTNVALGDVQIGAIGERDSQRFEVKFIAIEAPRIEERIVGADDVPSGFGGEDDGWQ